MVLRQASVNHDTTRVLIVVVEESGVAHNLVFANKTKSMLAGEGQSRVDMALHSIRI